MITCKSLKLNIRPTNSDFKYYDEMARNYELIQRAETAKVYRVAAFAYVREALNEYLETREAKRVQGEMIHPRIWYG